MFAAIRPDLYDEANLREEVIDVLLEAMVLAQAVGVQNIGKAMNDKLDKLYKRHGYN